MFVGQNLSLGIRKKKTPESLKEHLGILQPNFDEVELNLFKMLLGILPKLYPGNQGKLS